MEKTSYPKVKLLAEGSALIAKQMEAAAGTLMPKHLASLNSILFVHEGECVFNQEGEEIILKEGDAISIPAKTKHQIRATTDFKGVHFMPKEIEFKYFV